MNWKTSQENHHLPDCSKKVVQKLQHIFNGNKLMAVVIDVKKYEEFTPCTNKQEKKTLAATFERLRSICEEEEYELMIPCRINRELIF